LGGDVVSMEIEGNADALIDRINSLDWIKSMTRHDETLSLTMEKGERRIPALIHEAEENGVNVTCVLLRKPSLEDVFLHFTGRTIRDEEASQSERNLAMIRARMGRRMGRR
ncbi:MAG: DUF4162 domain-containing protein, partial [Candidatus Aminicenantes bacterium]|nr:DUF4162 domain-containing protein [Candidatus Aminicenantes bacterium]